MAETLPAEREARFWAGAEEATRFFMGQADVQRALARLAETLDRLQIKLASGLSAPHRLKDLADVLELMRALGLPAELADSLDPSLRAKYAELWQAAQTRDRE
jgi:hypothetical protein